VCLEYAILYCRFHFVGLAFLEIISQITANKFTNLFRVLLAIHQVLPMLHHGQVAWLHELSLIEVSHTLSHSLSKMIGVV